MELHSKALVYKGKALPEAFLANYDKAMLSTAAILAEKLKTVMDESGITPTEIAAYCGVSKQAVNGWKKTGRIDKKHLPKLASLFKREISWWVLETPEPAAAHANWPGHTGPSPERIPNSKPAAAIVSVWPFESIQQHEYERLSASQRSAVEGFIRGLLAQGQIDKSGPAARAA